MAERTMTQWTRPVKYITTRYFPIDTETVFRQGDECQRVKPASARMTASPEEVGR